MASRRLCVINEVIIDGYLADDPEIYKTEKGRKYCRIFMAHNHPGYGNGADYIKCKGSSGVAEVAEKYLKKGSHIIVFGALRQEHYENWQGRDIYELVIVISYIRFLPNIPQHKFVDEFFALKENKAIKKQYLQFVKEVIKPNEPDDFSEVRE